MANQTWLESSLRRSASLGLEVLERASRRSVDWRTSGASQTSSSSTDEDAHIPVKVPRTRTELDEVFANIANYMAQTTYQCKRFYESGCCTEPTDAEEKHVCRFHSRLTAGMTTPALSSRKHARTRSNKGRVSAAAAAGEDFFIEVSPGTYAVTASRPQSRQQTQLVSVRAGESINLTFDL